MVIHQVVVPILLRVATWGGAGASSGLGLTHRLYFTAAVSLIAGVDAIASAFPTLWPHRVILALSLLVLIMLVNLRGLLETGTLMSIPVYLFLFTYLPMLAYGLVRLWIDGPGDLSVAAPAAIHPLTAILVLRAFSSGCTALTGIEAISNGVPAFRKPSPRMPGAH